MKQNQRLWMLILLDWRGIVKTIGTKLQESQALFIM